MDRKPAVAVQDDYLARCGRVIDELKSTGVLHVEKAELRPTTLDVLTDPDWVFGDIAERTRLTLVPGVRELFRGRPSAGFLVQHE